MSETGKNVSIWIYSKTTAFCMAAELNSPLNRIRMMPEEAESITRLRA